MSRRQRGYTSRATRYLASDHSLTMIVSAVVIVSCASERATLPEAAGMPEAINFYLHL